MLPLYVFNRRSGENLLKYQLDSSCVIMSSILMTTVFYKAVILQGEIWYWSLYNYGYKHFPLTLERERLTFTRNGRREFVPRDQVFPYFPFTLYCFYTKISRFKPVLAIGIVWDCFYLLILYSEKFSTWVWRLRWRWILNLSIVLPHFS